MSARTSARCTSPVNWWRRARRGRRRHTTGSPGRLRTPRERWARPGTDRPGRRGGADRGRDPVRHRPRATHDGRRPGDRRPDADDACRVTAVADGWLRAVGHVDGRAWMTHLGVGRPAGAQQYAEDYRGRARTPVDATNGTLAWDAALALPTISETWLRLLERSGTPVGGGGRGAGEAGSHGVTRLRGAAYGDRCAARRRAAMRRRVSGTSPRPGPTESRRPVICWTSRPHGTSLPRRVGRPAGAVAAQRLSE